MWKSYPICMKGGTRAGVHIFVFVQPKERLPHSYLLPFSPSKARYLWNKDLCLSVMKLQCLPSRGWCVSTQLQMSGISALTWPWKAPKAPWKISGSLPWCKNKFGSYSKRPDDAFQSVQKLEHLLEKRENLLSFGLIFLQFLLPGTTQIQVGTLLVEKNF